MIRWFLSTKFPIPSGENWRNGLTNTRLFMPLLIGTIGSAKRPVITTAPSKMPQKRQSGCWRMPERPWQFGCSNFPPPSFGRIRTNVWKSDPRTYGCSPLSHSNVLTLDLDLKLFAFLERRRKSPKQLGNHLQILQADHLDRRMHVTIGQTDQC